MAAAEAENSTDDAYIAEALNKLSLKEREEILYNMHGVGEAFEETPEIVRRGLEEFEQCLDGMQGKRKASAYRTALSVSKEYVEREDLILLFLRSQRFDAKRAARRFLLHFDKKLQLFGKPKLCKDITQDDLCRDDLDCMRNGHLQVLPSRDSLGRPVLVSLPGFVKYGKLDNVVSILCI